MGAGKHGLKRELRLRDLVPMQIAIIVWLGWISYAAKQGSSQVALWVLAIVLFYLPLAAVVIKLSRAIPVEGGVYQWVKEGFSPLAGYIAAWNLTVYGLFAFAVVGPVIANSFSYATGPGRASTLLGKPFTLTATVAGCLIAYIFNVRGLHLAKWASAAGSITTVLAFLALMFLLVRAWVVKMPLVHNSFSLAWPPLSILTLNVFSKMAIGALSGFDSSAVFTEECRRPENDVGRSVVIASPLIALMYILGTSALLAYISPASADLASPVPQVIRAGFGAHALGNTFTIAASVGVTISFMAAMVVFVGVIARLPMVAGWDGLLPNWWSELHPRFRTPSKAIAMVTLTMAIIGALMLIGAGNQEAVQVGIAASNASLAIVYMLIFGIALAGFRSRALRFSVGLRVAALAGFLVGLFALAFEIFPLGDVASPLIFGMKVAAAVLVTNVFGAFLYWRGAQRVRTLAASAGS